MKLGHQYDKLDKEKAFKCPVCGHGTTRIIQHGMTHEGRINPRAYVIRCDMHSGGCGAQNTAYDPKPADSRQIPDIKAGPGLPFSEQSTTDEGLGDDTL